MFKIKKQINILYITSVLWNLSITGAWVAILAARGFSLVQIGIAETIFHITSLLFEIPSGVLADVLGRKKMLILSNILSIAACLIMAVTTGFAGVCISFVFNALSWNFASGSGDALAYDSLKMVGETDRYEKYTSNQTIIYRVATGVSTLCAGLALFLGYRIAYLLSVVNHAIALLFLLQLTEVEHTDEAEETADDGSPEQEAAKAGDADDGTRTRSVTGVLAEMIHCFAESLRFLKDNPKVSALMFANSLVGAFDILLLFFLQSKLRDAGLADRLLGFALFAMELGGIAGAKVILLLKKCKYAWIFSVSTLIVLLGIALEHTGIALVMVLGGFLSAAADDALQVRTDAKLQDLFASGQRSTLISIFSFVFSVVMIVLSPLAGWFFSIW
ncbi:MAG: MFS transporter [Lachnospiraceae bacterium]|nr:MFS transporter [Lachnospiraceae bacterium]